MYYKGEYIQNILLKNPSETQIIIIILNHGVYFITTCHEKFTIYDQKKKGKKKFKTC
jgi:hypothetical protein